MRAVGSPRDAGDANGVRASDSPRLSGEGQGVRADANRLLHFAVKKLPLVPAEVGATDRGPALPWRGPSRGAMGREDQAVTLFTSVQSGRIKGTTAAQTSFACQGVARAFVAKEDLPHAKDAYLLSLKSSERAAFHDETGDDVRERKSNCHYSRMGVEPDLYEDSPDFCYQWWPQGSIFRNLKGTDHDYSQAFVTFFRCSQWRHGVGNPGGLQDRRIRVGPVRPRIDFEHGCGQVGGDSNLAGQISGRRRMAGTGCGGFANRAIHPQRQWSSRHHQQGRMGSGCAPRCGSARRARGDVRLAGPAPRR